MQTLILADNQDVTRYGMKAIAAGLYPVCVYVEALDWKSLAESLAEYPEACVVLDYTLLDCSVEQLLVLHERFRRLTLYCLVISWGVILCVECCLRARHFMC